MTSPAADTRRHPRRKPVQAVTARIVWLLCLTGSAVAATLAAMSLSSGRTDRGHLLAWTAAAALAVGALVWWRWRRALHNPPRR